MPTPDELQGQIDSLTQRLNAALNRISDLEDFAEGHLGLDWGESLVDANSPHPNISVNTLESGGGIIRQDRHGMQVQGNAATAALYFVQTLKTNPGAAPYRVVFQGAVTESSGLVGSDWQIESETSNEAAGFSLSIVNDSNSEASFSITYNGSTGSAGARWASSVGIPLFYVQDMGLALTSALSPAQITADQNNYNPADLAIAAVLRLSSDASRDITGLAGGADGRVFLVFNVGSNNIVLKDESASSTAANRFALNGDVTLQPDNSVGLWYDSTSSRWRAF